MLGWVFMVDRVKKKSDYKPGADHPWNKRARGYTIRAIEDKFEDESLDLRLEEAQEASRISEDWTEEDI